MSCGCGCSGNSGGCQGNCGAVKIITEQGVKGDKGDTGDTGATGPPGANGADGLGYDNMLSSSSINLSLVLPFSSSGDIQVDKAVTFGTRLRYTKISDQTQWIEGVVTSYNVGSGACAVDFDNKSATATGSHNDWAVTVIGEPGAGSSFSNITNVGTGEDVFKGVNGSDAEFKRMLGGAGLNGGVTTSGDDVLFEPLTANDFPDSPFPNTLGNCTVVYRDGDGIAPSFNYSPIGGESLVSPGSLNTTSTHVVYYDFNDFIYLVFEVVIDDFHLNPADGTRWSILGPSFQVNGLPVVVASTSQTSQIVRCDMYYRPNSQTNLSLKDDFMFYNKALYMYYGNGFISAANPGTGGQDVAYLPANGSSGQLKFVGRMLLNKNTITLL